jgi:hypothetical protein
MKDNYALYLIGRLMPPWAHRIFSRATGWMFAQVWIRDEQRHQWMWVDEGRYYSGGQSINSRQEAEGGTK